MNKNIFSILLMGITLLIMFSQAQSQVVESDLIISELLYNPPGSDTIEFIEFFNNGDSPFNLSNCKLSGPFNYSFQDVSIPPKGYYLITKDSAVMQNSFNLSCADWGSGSLTNNGKTITIKDGNGNILDELSYTNSSPWPTISSSGGASIELNCSDTDNSDGANWKLSTHFMLLLNNGDSLCCTPGSANLPYLPDAIFEANNRIIQNSGSIDFINKSYGNNLSYQWHFDGGNPSTSVIENPKVNYNNFGFYDVSLEVSEGNNTDTETKTSYIAVIKGNCNNIINLPYEIDFQSIPDCWIIQPTSGNGAWKHVTNQGHTDKTSMKFPCNEYPTNTVGKLISEPIKISTHDELYLSMYYKSEEINSGNSPTMLINTYNEDIKLLQTFNIDNFSVNDWVLFNTSIDLNTKYIEIKIKNNYAEGSIYIDDFKLSASPINTFKLSGFINDGTNGISNIPVTIGDSIIVNTDTEGKYSCYLPGGWTGLIALSSADYIFNPQYLELINISEDMLGFDFIANKLPEGWSHEPTFSSHTFCITETALINENIATGSWIGAFYTDTNGVEKCCGAYIYQNEPALCLNAWAKDAITGLTGFSEGEEIKWKLADAITGDILEIEVHYSDGPTSYQNDGLTMIDIFSVVKHSQTLLIPKGWSAISSLVIPQDMTLDKILTDVSDKVEVLMNDSGIYMPGTTFSTIDKWDPESGWLIKCKDNLVLPIIGSYNENLDVSLSKGWTLFPIKSTKDVDLENIFKNILNNVIIVKGYGLNEIYIPGISNNILLKTGKAYKVRMTQGATISFNNKLGTVLNNYTYTENFYIPEFNPFNNEVTITANSHSFIFETQDLNDGDIIGAFNSEGLCTGICKVNNNTAIFDVFGDDFSTEKLDGMINGEHLNFKLYRNGYTYNLQTGLAYNTINNLYYIDDGITYIDKIQMSPIGIKDNNSDKIHIYPNPFRDILYIRVNGNISYNLVIYNLMGDIIHRCNISSGTNTIKTNKLSKGTYIIKCYNRSDCLFRKIVKL